MALIAVLLMMIEVIVVIMYHRPLFQVMMITRDVQAVTSNNERVSAVKC